jgi:hypothetical protein
MAMTRRPRSWGGREGETSGNSGVITYKLRQDRILDEARHTADPVHLMRVFGVVERQSR